MSKTPNFRRFHEMSEHITAKAACSSCGETVKQLRKAVLKDIEGLVRVQIQKLEEENMLKGLPGGGKG
jgi:bacterioferritin-associated ferredoxin